MLSIEKKDISKLGECISSQEKDLENNLSYQCPVQFFRLFVIKLQ